MAGVPPSDADSDIEAEWRVWRDDVDELRANQSTAYVLLHCRGEHTSLHHPLSRLYVFLAS